MKEITKIRSEKDFGEGSVSGNILRIAVPLTLAQLINILYNLVDRIYIGHLPQSATEALTGIGLTLPVITIFIAFSNLFGMGGAPLFSMARGAGERERAARIMGNSFSLLLLSGAVLAIIGFVCKRPLLYLFGASDTSFVYANEYLSIYLFGTLFVMISLGMNQFINAQGFAITGMLTVSIGAVINLVLDPIFIFVLHMGVKGAALATVCSQAVSAIWVLSFFLSGKAPIGLDRRHLRLQPSLIKEITSLGLSGFAMAITNSLVQIACNVNLQTYGGDLYVGIMTVVNSVREFITLPVTGLSSGAQPVMSFNYGAKKYDRVKAAIRFSTVYCVLFTVAMWALIFFLPGFFIRLFSSDAALLADGIPAMRIYFAGIFMMALQFSGQSTFVALGKSKHAIFFSLLRKVIIVLPLTFLLPRIGGLGSSGVFLAEPISNAIGGTASFVTMLVTVWRRLGKETTQKK